jgi:hypothetical protein
MWEKKYELEMSNFKSKYHLYKVFGFHDYPNFILQN